MLLGASRPTAAKPNWTLSCLLKFPLSGSGGVLRGAGGKSGRPRPTEMEMSLWRQRSSSLLAEAAKKESFGEQFQCVSRRVERGVALSEPWILHRLPLHLKEQKECTVPIKFIHHPLTGLLMQLLNLSLQTVDVAGNRPSAPLLACWCQV